jgi:hypothetical protein
VERTIARPGIDHKAMLPSGSEPSTHFSPLTTAKYPAKLDISGLSSERSILTLLAQVG